MKKAWALLVVLALGTALSAQDKPKVLDRDTFMDMESVAGTNISPDGRQIVFAREWIDQMKDQSRTNLWVMDADSGRVRELTRGSWRDSAPVWAPDSKRIAFLSDRDGTNQIHVLYVDTGDVAQLTHLQRAATALKWSPDGKQIAFTQTIPDEDPIVQIELPKRPRGAEWAKGRRCRRSHLRGRATAPGRSRKATATSSPLTRPSAARRGRSPTASSTTAIRNGARTAAGSMSRHQEAGRRVPAATTREIYAIDLKSLAVTPLTDRKGPDTNPTVSPDGKLIAYTGYDDKNFTSHLANLYLMDADRRRQASAGWQPDELPGRAVVGCRQLGPLLHRDREGIDDASTSSPSKGEVHPVTQGDAHAERRLDCGQRTGGGGALDAAGAGLRGDVQRPRRIARGCSGDEEARGRERGRAGRRARSADVEEMWFTVEGRAQDPGLAR